MLHVPTGANTFCLTTPSWGTTRPNSANGTSVTPGTGGYGSNVQLGSDLTQDAYGILINMNSNFVSAGSRNTVVTIGVDESGGTSPTDRITGLMCGGSAVYTRNGGGNWYYFPLFIPAGSAIFAKAYGSVATAIRVGCVTFGQPANAAMIRKGSYVETLGIGTYSGVAITPGTTSDGAWALVGTTTLRTWWVQFGFQVNTADVGWNLAAIHVDVAVGDAGTKDIIIQDANFCTDSGEYVGNPPLTAGVEWDIPPGSNIYMRAQSSGTLDAYNGAVYLLGG